MEPNGFRSSLIAVATTTTITAIDVDESGTEIEGWGEAGIMSDPAEYAAATFRVARILVERRPTEVRANSASNLTPRCKRAPQSWWMCFERGRKGERRRAEAGPVPPPRRAPRSHDTLMESNRPRWINSGGLAALRRIRHR